VSDDTGRRAPPESGTDQVFVTGATGVLGRHLCRRLVADGRDVRALCRPTSDRSVLASTDVEWVVGDVTDGARMRELVADCSRVYHLAGIGLDSGDAVTVRHVNVRGTEAVVEAALATGVDRLVFTSTAGTRRSVGLADESDIAAPLGAYQASKAQAERIVDDAASRGLETVTVHPTSVFGPGDESFTGRVLSMGTSSAMVAYPPGGLSIVDVRDVVDGTIAAMARGRPGEHYILGGQNLAIGAAARIVADEVDGTAPIVPVPETALHLAGRVAERLESHAGIRVFPYDRDMAALATMDLFYTSEKARRELDYEYRPFRAAIEPALRWFRDEADTTEIADAEAPDTETVGAVSGETGDRPTADGGSPAQEST
jgi:dihydroflavonol-4-reductase